MCSQNDMERLRDRMDLGVLSADEANIEMVRTERVKIISSKLPIRVRRALNNAVKSGRLGHVKKNGLMPEVYYPPEFEYLVSGTRKKCARNSIEAIAKVCV